VHAILIGFGSAGDVLPLVIIGRALKARGHRVSVIANGHFAPVVARAALEFIEFGSKELYQQSVASPAASDPVKSLRSLMAIVGEAAQPLYEMLADRFVPGETVAVATTLAFGARLAQEKLGLPLATVHLSPLSLRSDQEDSVLPGVPWLRGAMNRWVGWAGDRLLLDPPVLRTLGPLRAKLGLPPIRRTCYRWWNSTTHVLGLFPSWYGPPQPDWPAQARLVGFLRDSADDEPQLSPELLAFLDAGPPPVVFTPGSAHKHGAGFFEAARIACDRLKVRALFVTQFSEQIPAGVSGSILHVKYAPFGRLLRRAAAISHHGGIGTAVQAMAAGIPQLVVPVGYDQPDNAARLQRLGVARTLSPRRFRAEAATRELQLLLTSPDVARSCRSVQEYFAIDTGCDTAVAIIEGMLDPPVAHAPSRAGEA
jgi:UDP:flavonoid glycosyltransferase YjiC (YdhE family)